MADNDLGDKNTNGNDWDVVSLTASTYAASPSYEARDLNSYGSMMPVFGGKTPSTIFLSDHFVFPPSEHENLPLEPDIAEHVEVESAEDDTEEGSVSGDYDEELGQLGTSNELHEQRPFGEMLVEEEAFQFKGVEVSGKAASLSSNLLNSKMVKDDKLQSDIPSVSWWKRHAASLYSNAKESNSFWSIFVVAAVTGLVVIGKRWQQERWQVLQKLHLNVNDEKISMLLGPLTRLKEAVIRSHDRISFLRTSAPIIIKQPL